MAENILVCTAWPYVNGSLHVGHLAGVYVPADTFARFHRLRGNNVLMVSGSDEHGTPITVRAEQEGVSPKEIADRYHEEFLGYWRDLGISYDLYTRTGTDVHRRVVQAQFLDLLEKGYLNQRTTAAGTAAMRRLTQSLIDLSASVGGTFFLPYQLHYTPQQLERAYPAISEFFRAKRRYDPGLLLTNTFYETYAPFWPST